MSEVFYRKYRPRVFEEVAGQANVLKILRNAVEQNKIAHAYLFSGPRGTGKTTLARILSREVGCAPEDTIEIDAASQRGIDDARALREGVRVLPFRSLKKSYIIDEVHMLTREAFNALLKTLEEPPEHALFILCTTELEKVPETIVSRTQHCRFNKISLPDMALELKKISKKENLEIEDGAVRLIAFFAEGSLRDAQNILFQATSFGKKITESNLRLFLGVPSGELVNSIKLSLLAKNPKIAIEFLDKALKNGVDSATLSRFILYDIRETYLSKLANMSGNDANFFDFSIRELLWAMEQKTDDYTSHIPLELALIKIATQNS